MVKSPYALTCLPAHRGGRPDPPRNCPDALPTLPSRRPHGAARGVWSSRSAVDSDEVGEGVPRRPQVLAGSAVDPGRIVRDGAMDRAALPGAVPGAARVSEAVIGEVVGLGPGAPRAGEVADVCALDGDARPFSAAAPGRARPLVPQLELCIPRAVVAAVRIEKAHRRGSQRVIAVVNLYRVVQPVEVVGEGSVIRAVLLPDRHGERVAVVACQ